MSEVPRGGGGGPAMKTSTLPSTCAQICTEAGSHSGSQGESSLFNPQVRIHLIIGITLVVRPCAMGVLDCEESRWPHTQPGHNLMWKHL